MQRPSLAPRAARLYSKLIILDGRKNKLLRIRLYRELCYRTLVRLRRPRSRGNKLVTPRELDCLLWAGEGKTDWEISVILGISPSTVTKHIASARDKLNAGTRHTLSPWPYV
ncbi:helix-turn-helix transcriptional regulator [Nitrobacter hamburgensis]|uniref:helix-turn-helix transcriptional regulator n=1 Tax=Nitrobacter hamburgensis TaxID=912 RepID=UPI001FD9D4CE|nr:helix-turn-helix transcriptional regulator [Nitrobacter hamburgensis]